MVMTDEDRNNDDDDDILASVTTYHILHTTYQIPNTTYINQGLPATTHQAQALPPLLRGVQSEDHPHHNHRQCKEVARLKTGLPV